MTALEKEKLFLIELISGFTDLKKVLQLRQRAEQIQRPKKPLSEKQILYQLMNVYVIPPAEKQRFLELEAIKKSRAYTKEEKEELFELIDQEEAMRVERVKLLIQLSALKKIPLPELVQQLDLQRFGDAA